MRDQLEEHDFRDRRPAADVLAGQPDNFKHVRLFTRDRDSVSGQHIPQADRSMTSWTRQSGMP